MGADAQEDPAHRAGGRRAASMGKIVQATAVARLASQGGWGKEPPPPTIPGSPRAVQGQCRRWPSSPP